jgi:hypothetical protein
MRANVLLLLACLFAAALAGHVDGAVEVDNFTFEKVRQCQNVVVVWQEHSWKEINKFKEVVEQLRLIEGLLILIVDGSNKANELLLQRFGVAADKLPQVHYLLRGSTEPDRYSGELSSNTTPEGLVQWVRAKSSPSLAALIELAKGFAEQEKDAQVARVESANQLLLKLTGLDAQVGLAYIKNMAQIVQQGAEYVSKEKARLQKLVDNKATIPSKKEEFNRRLHLLSVFEHKSAS